MHVVLCFPICHVVAFYLLRTEHVDCLSLILFLAASLYQIKPDEAAYIVTQGEEFVLEISAVGPYGCDAVYEVSQPSHGLIVERSKDGIYVELDTVEVILIV